MDIAIQLKKRNLEVVGHRQQVLNETYILNEKLLHLILYYLLLG